MAHGPRQPAGNLAQEEKNIRVLVQITSITCTALYRGAYIENSYDDRALAGTQRRWMSAVLERERERKKLAAQVVFTNSKYPLCGNKPAQFTFSDSARPETMS